MFTDTDEPLTFVAHSDQQVMRAWKNQTLKNENRWVFEIFTPAGMVSFWLDHKKALDLAAMFTAVVSKKE